MRELQRAFVSSTAYALALSTPFGKRLRQEHTWATVVIGVALTLYHYYQHRPDPELKALQFFAATGTPIVAMAILEEMKHWEQVLQWAVNTDRGSGRSTR
jgi:hypothetical protein